MIKILLILAIPALLLCQNTGLITQSMHKPTVLVQNKPLARAANQFITVMDVKRKMDLYLQEYYPQVLSDVNAKVQFYTNYFKYSLDELILQKLMVAEAEEKEIKISEPDIHQEMHNRFGASPIQKLLDLNITFEDCKKQIKEEIIMQNMLHFNASMRALHAATPKAIISSYHDFLEKSPPKDSWKYQVMTIKGDDAKQCDLKQCQKAAQDAKELLSKMKMTHLNDILKIASENKLLEDVQVNVSNTFISGTNELSTEHKSILLNLKENTFSEPILQHSRATNSEVFRIFHLLEYKEATPITLKEKSDELRNNIINKEFEKRKSTYYNKLKERYLVEIFENTNNLNPFSIG